MQGVPTTVSVSSAFLQKCMNDPEKAYCQMVAGPEAATPGEGKNSWLTGTAPESGNVSNVDAETLIADTATAPTSPQNIQHRRPMSFLTLPESRHLLFLPAIITRFTSVPEPLMKSMSRL